MKDSFKEANTPSVSETTPLVRRDEENKHWFRSDRFIIIDHKWYFTTRENRDVDRLKIELMQFTVWNYL
jgi:hypothetical protein